MKNPRTKEKIGLLNKDGAQRLKIIGEEVWRISENLLTDVYLKSLNLYKRLRITKSV